ncbi:TPA: phage tail protein [Proteus mirabilis]
MKNPKLISKPFAQNGQKNVIPEKYETSMESNQATWDQGFGQITMLPVSAGGLPPKGQDFNGILNQISETLVHISKGGVFKFSADYATAINGYPKGAILQSEDEKKYYQSLIDNNKVNFNTASQDQIKTSWKLVMTDDLLNQLSKKLESSAVVQSTGTSTTSVMSQKASTDAFQPKGNYQPSGNYALKGDSYTKSEENNLLGGKLDKSGGEVGALTVTTNSHGRNIQLKRSDSTTDSPKPELISFHHGDDKRRGYIGYGGFNNTLTISNEEENASINIESSRLNFNGESVLTKTEAGKIFQPKGNYQPSGNYALKGDSYTKAEENNLLNNKLDKSGGDVGAITVTTTGSGRVLQIKRQDSTIESPQPELISFHHGDGGRRGYVGFGGFDNVIRIANDETGNSLLVSDTLKFNSERVLTESDLTISHPIPWSLSNAPTGYLICQGQTFNKSTYPKLAIAYPSGKLPDLRGEFIRGLDSGRGVDAGREVLSSQSGNSLLSAMWRGTVTGQEDWENKTSYNVEIGTNNSGYFTIGQQIEGQNGNETRPRNIAFLYIVRAA